MGLRTTLAVPFLREGVPLGTITLWKTEVAPFTDKLDSATKVLVPGLDGLSAFFYNNSGIFQPSDAHGGWGRGQLDVNISSPFGNAHRGGSNQ